MSTSASAPVEPVVRVSTLELFFDLVFVFTVTQLTAVLAASPTWGSAARMFMILGIIYWMYDGYAWMTNTVAPTDPIRRGLLLAGMGGFLLIALAIPEAFGAGYFVVNAIHSGLLLRANPAAMRALAPLNLLSATLVLVGGLVEAGIRPWIWLAALLVQGVSPYLHKITEWSINSAHFVERHGLIVIVALGESIVAIGVGAAGLKLDGTLVGTAMLGLVLSFGLWWLYFGGDDTAAEEALEATPVANRARKALHAFGFAHWPLLFGVAAFAAGVKKAIVYASGHVYLEQALLLGGGVAVFLLADVWFRRILLIGTLKFRAAGAVAALASVALGVRSTLAQLVALVAILVAVLLLEKRVRAD